MALKDIMKPTKAKVAAILLGASAIAGQVSGEIPKAFDRGAATADGLNISNRIVDGVEGETTSAGTKIMQGITAPMVGFMAGIGESFMEDDANGVTQADLSVRTLALPANIVAGTLGGLKTTFGYSAASDQSNAQLAAGWKKSSDTVGHYSRSISFGATKGPMGTTP